MVQENDGDLTEETARWLTEYENDDPYFVGALFIAAVELRLLAGIERSTEEQFMAVVHRAVARVRDYHSHLQPGEE
jgi:hypothetical protein